MIKQIYRMFISPGRFLKEQREENRLGWEAIIVSFALICIFRRKEIMQGEITGIVLRVATSVILLWLYLSVLVKVCRGQYNKMTVVNASLYTHVFYIIVNRTQYMGIPGVVLFVVAHAYAFKIELEMFKLLACKVENIRVIIGIQIGVICYFFIAKCIYYIGEYLIYMPKSLYYPLIG